MRRFHLIVGIAVVVVFLLTGLWMRRHEPPMNTLSDAMRLMHRSRHIYILASGLVNLMLGLYIQHRPAGWRGRVQWIGSGLLIASPMLLVLAFSVEPGVGFRGEMWWSRLGLYTLFGGCMLHLTSASGSRKASKKPASE